MIMDDIAQQLEEVEDHIDAGETHEQGGEIKKPAADDVNVEDLEEPIAGGSRIERCGLCTHPAVLESPLFHAANEIHKPILDELKPHPHPAHLAKHQEPAQTKNRVGHPQSYGGVDATL